MAPGSPLLLVLLAAQPFKRILLRLNRLVRWRQGACRFHHLTNDSSPPTAIADEQGYFPVPKAVKWVEL